MRCCFFTAAVLLLYCCFTAVVSQLMHTRDLDASPALPPLYCCVTAASLMLYLRGTGSAGGAYGQSKLAQIMHMRELQRRVPDASALLLPRYCFVTAALLLLYCCF
jgi:hypothetical protein